MYKVNNDMVPSYIKDLFPQHRNQETNYLLRNNEDFTLPMARTALFQKSCIPASIPLWNSLSAEIRNSTSFSSFKAKTATNYNRIKITTGFFMGKDFIL